MLAPAEFREDLALLVRQRNEQLAELAEAEAQLGAWAPQKVAPIGEPVWYRKLPIEERAAAYGEVQRARNWMDLRTNLAARVEALRMNLESLDQQIGNLTEMSVYEEALLASL